MESAVRPRNPGFILDECYNRDLPRACQIWWAHEDGVPEALQEALVLSGLDSTGTFAAQRDDNLLWRRELQLYSDGLEQRDSEDDRAIPISQQQT